MRSSTIPAANHCSAAAIEATFRSVQTIACQAQLLADNVGQALAASSEINHNVAEISRMAADAA